MQIHDQGAGGNCNVVKEIIYPLGAEVDIRAVRLGDATMSVLEIWGAEYQENDCLLIRAEHRALLEAVCARERACMQVRRRWLPGRPARTRQPCRAYVIRSYDVISWIARTLSCAWKNVRGRLSPVLPPRGIPPASAQRLSLIHISEPTRPY